MGGGGALLISKDRGQSRSGNSVPQKSKNFLLFKAKQVNS